MNYINSVFRRLYRSNPYDYLSSSVIVDKYYRQREMFKINCKNATGHTTHTSVSCCSHLNYRVQNWFNPPIQWRHNERDGVSRLFTQPFVQAHIKEIIKAPRHWPLWGEFTGEFPAQRVSDAENVSIWWRHHAKLYWTTNEYNTMENGTSCMISVVIRKLTCYLMFKCRKMSHILKTKFSKLCYWIEWLCTEQATNHYLNHWWPGSMTYRRVTRPQGVNVRTGLITLETKRYQSIFYPSTVFNSQRRL